MFFRICVSGPLARLCLIALLFALPMISFSAETRQTRQRPRVGFLGYRDADKNLRLALDEALGQGHGHKIENLEEVGKKLKPTFRALPKNDQGRLDGAGVRYLMHSYFLKEHGWMIRGLEPQKGANVSDAAAHGPVEVLHQKAPHFVKSISDRQVQGFELEDAVVLVALMEHLILDEGIHVLEAAYGVNGFSTNDLLAAEQLDPVLESYLLLFAFGNRRDHWNATQHQMDRAKIHKLWPAWSDREALARDLHRNIAVPQRSEKNPFTNATFSFEHATKAMVKLSQEFGKIHDIECRDLKDSFIEMDPKASGRLPLGSFYAKRKVGYWHLRESPSYLRHLGILDETAWNGAAQVIIPNYVTSMTNCDAPSEYFSICCMHECEGLLNKIEVSVQAPTAGLQQILQQVSNLPSSTIEAPRNLSTALVNALESVVEVHGGEVPLHGRLFAQWLHYAFPHECPYPHKSGALDMPLSATDWARQNKASGSVTREEYDWHLKNTPEETRSMAMWTLDEELRAGGSVPGERRRAFMSACATLAQVTAAGLVLMRVWRLGAKAFQRSASVHGMQASSKKEHLV